MSIELSVAGFGVTTSNLYWVSAIVLNDNDKRPWCLPISDGCSNLDKAFDLIKSIRKNNNVLSAWVDTFDENDNKTTVYHECFVDAVGNVDKIK